MHNSIELLKQLKESYDKGLVSALIGAGFTKNIYSKAVGWWELLKGIVVFAYDIELDNDVILTPLVKNIDKFNYWLEALPFYMNVQREGVVLNE